MSSGEDLERSSDPRCPLRSSRVSVRANHVAGLPARFAPGTIPQPAGSDEWRHTSSHSCRGCVTHFTGQVGWSGFAGGLRSAIARGTVLPTLFERQISRCHQVCIGGQTISGQDHGDPCVEVVLSSPILVVAPAIGGRRVSREDLCERFDVAHIARRRVGGRPQGHLQGKNVYSGSKGQGRMPESAVG